MPYVNQSPLEYRINTTSSLPIIYEPRPPTNNVDGRRTRLLTLWLDTTSDDVYALVFSNSTASTWVLLGGTAGASEEFLPDSGTSPIVPNASNQVSILGGDTVTTVGSLNTLTITTTASGYPITPYVVGPAGQAGYATVQAGIDAANAAGGGLVFIQPGTYTEDLTLYDGVNLMGGNDDDTIITGTHTPPATGIVNFFRITFTDAAAIFSSAAAGTTNLTLDTCVLNVTNGFSFDLANWTGQISIINGSSAGTQDGFSNNTGGASLYIHNSIIGKGTSNTMLSTGTVIIEESVVNPPWNPQTGTSFSISYSNFNQAVPLSNNSTGTFSHCNWNTGAATPITMSSSAGVDLNQCRITTSANPAIAGAGAGTLTLTDVIFTSGAVLAGTLTLGTSSIHPVDLANGELLIGSTGQVAVASTLTAGTGISINNAAGSITINATGGGLTWQVETGASANLVAGNGFFANNAVSVTFTLPATAAVGDTFEIAAMHATGTFIIAQNGGQTVHVGNVNTTTGAGGTITSTDVGDWIQIVCNIQDTDFHANVQQGNLTIV